jgi:hypothetical protein
MKHLRDYSQEKQTQLFKQTNTFFAFSKKQFEEGKKESITYVSLGAGMLCDKTQVKTLTDGLHAINEEAIKQDIKENGIKNIIWREFANYECQLGMDYTDASNALADYPITDEQINEQWKPFFDNCVKNDYF